MGIMGVGVREREAPVARRGRIYVQGRGVSGYNCRQRLSGGWWSDGGNIAGRVLCIMREEMEMGIGLMTILREPKLTILAHLPARGPG